MLDSIGRNNRKIENKPCENCGKDFRPVDSKKELVQENVDILSGSVTHTTKTKALDG